MTEYLTAETYDGQVTHVALPEPAAEAAETVAASAGVLQSGPRCGASRRIEDSLVSFSVSCCRGEHRDPWHVDGRFPTTPWRSDDLDKIAAAGGAQ